MMEYVDPTIGLHRLESAAVIEMHRASDEKIMDGWCYRSLDTLSSEPE
jgi:hypothetical protein